MYFLKRLLLAIPTLWLISLVTFGLSHCATDDPVRALRPDNTRTISTMREQEAQYRSDAALYGFDKPLFYFNVGTAAFPDTFYRILMPEQRRWFGAWVSQTGHWPLVQNWYNALDNSTLSLEGLPDSLGKAELRAAFGDLRKAERLEQLAPALDSLDKWLAFFQKTNPGVQISENPLPSLRAQALELASQPRSWRHYWPDFNWLGFDNQYHNWLTGFFTGNLGTSFNWKRPVGELIAARLPITLTINGLALLLAYLVALPLGLFLARAADRVPDKWLRAMLMLLYAMPVFWLGGLLIMSFATHGQGWQIFPGIGAGDAEDSLLSSGQWILKNGARLVLPVLVLALHTLAMVALQMRASTLSVVNQDFIRTARAKGLAEGAVFGRHAFRNALFPVITIFGVLFPAIFGGSLAVEYLFELPGMGTLTQAAFMARDMPVLFAVLMYSAVFTVAGGLLADFLYAFVDPRVRFTTD